MPKEPFKIFSQLGTGKHKVERRYVELGIFILIASFFWLLNALSKDYSTTISLPVRYSNIPTDKQLTNKLPNSITVHIDGHGFDLLKQKIGIHIFPHKIDVEEYMLPIKKNGNTQRFAILSNHLKPEVEAALDGQFRVNHIYPDSIPLIFSPIQSKRVPIKADININFAPQHQLSGKLKLKPDSVTVSGPQAILDSISYIVTEHLELSDINAATKRNVKLIKNELLKLSDKRTVIDIEVERFTEHTLQIPIKLINNTEFENIELLPAQASVKFLIGLSDFNAVKAEDFLLTAKIDPTDSLEDKLPVTLETFPAMVTILGTTPEQIDFVINRQGQNK